MLLVIGLEHHPRTFSVGFCWVNMVSVRPCLAGHDSALHGRFQLGVESGRQRKVGLLSSKRTEILALELREPSVLSSIFCLASSTAT